MSKNCLQLITHHSSPITRRTFMVTQRRPKPSKYLTIPTRPVQVDRDRSVAGLLEKMEGTGFGGRQLAEAHRIWLDMLGDNTTVYVGASGAPIPRGGRGVVGV